MFLPVVGVRAEVTTGKVADFVAFIKGNSASKAKKFTPLQNSPNVGLVCLVELPRKAGSVLKIFPKDDVESYSEQSPELKRWLGTSCSQ